MGPDMGWEAHAACRGDVAALFIAPDGGRRPERELRETAANAICAGCQVRRQCPRAQRAHPRRNLGRAERRRTPRGKQEPRATPRAVGIRAAGTNDMRAGDRRSDGCLKLRSGRKVILATPDLLHACAAEAASNCLLSAIGQGARLLIIDMSATVICDYAAPGPIVTACTRAIEAGTQVRLRPANWCTACCASAASASWPACTPRSPMRLRAGPGRGVRVNRLALARRSGSVRGRPNGLRSAPRGRKSLLTRRAEHCNGPTKLANRRH